MHVAGSLLRTQLQQGDPRGSGEQHGVEAAQAGRQRAAVGQVSNLLLIGKLLGVLDDFDRALRNVPPEAHDAWIEGVKLTERKLRGVLESEGVTPIEAVGHPFDPNLHEAISQQESDQPPGTVVTVLQRGYRAGDRLLRPSLVVVAKAKASAE